MAASMVDNRGSQSEPVRPLTLTHAEIMRSQDIAIVRMRTRNVSWSTIGKYFRMTHKGAMKRWNSIPPATRERYARAESLSLV